MGIEKGIACGGSGSVLGNEGAGMGIACGGGGGGGGICE